jgi:hypothetical protein
MATSGEGMRTSVALWAKALVANSMPAATATRVLMSMVIASLPCLTAPYLSTSTTAWANACEASSGTWPMSFRMRLCLLQSSRT